jgi:hypothetical protein
MNWRLVLVDPSERLALTCSDASVSPAGSSTRISARLVARTGASETISQRVAAVLLVGRGAGLAGAVVVAAVGVAAAGVGVVGAEDVPVQHATDEVTSAAIPTIG